MSEILMKPIISAVLLLALLAFAPTVGYAASANLTVHVAPVVTGTCSLGSHGAIRGRPTVSNGTLIADDGCPLRGMWGACDDLSAPTDPTNGQRLETAAGYACARDNYKVNMIRETLWVGGYFCDSCNFQENVAGDIARMDAAVAAANATGMYVMATNFSNSTTDCTTAFNNGNALWNGIAARYKDNTNVIFELQNEPDYMVPGSGCPGISSQMDHLYNIARGAAPSTPIIAWSFSSPSASTSYNLDGQIASATDISYANTVIGVHAYDSNLNAMTSFVQSENSHGRGVYMTEYGPCQDPGTGQGGNENGNWAPTIRNLESLGMDWVGSCVLDTVGQGGTNFITVFWPSDAGTGGGGCGSTCPAVFTTNFNQVYQTIDGFGGANAFLDLSVNTDAIDALFCITATAPCAAPGIGLSLMRRDAGAGTQDQSVVQAVAARGAKVWSTPWASPATPSDPSTYDAGANALVSEILSVGVPQYAVSTQNEPDIGGNGGSSWTPAQTAAFAAVLGPKLHALSPPVKLMAPEAGGGDYWDAIRNNPAANAQVDIFSWHMYGGLPSTTNDGSRHVWETEMAVSSGEGQAFDPSITDAVGGYGVANWIHDVLVGFNGSAWHYWWLWYPDFSCNCNDTIYVEGHLTKRYFAFGNFSRFIRPGWVRVGVTGSQQGLYGDMAFKNPATGEFAIVVINNGNPGVDIPNVSFGIQNASIVGNVTPYVTSGTPIGALGTDGNLSAGSGASGVPSSITPNGNIFTSTIPYGITTFVGTTGTVSPPSQKPVSIAFTSGNPTTVSDTTQSGAVISGINVGTSDGLAFGGTISLASQTNTSACSGSGLVNISSATLPSNVRANCTFTAALNGSPTVTINATENGTTVSATLTMNVTAPSATSAFDPSKNAGGYLTFSNSNLTATKSTGDGSNNIAFTTRFLSSGQHVFRFVLGACNGCAVGMADSAESPAGWLSEDTGGHSFGIFSSGYVGLNNTAQAGSTATFFASGDTVDLIVDLTAKTVREAVNGGPASAPVSIAAIATTNLTPAWSSGHTGDSVTFNGGAPVSYFGEANWDGIAVPTDYPTSITFDGIGGGTITSVTDATPSGTTIAGIHVVTHNIAPFGGTIALVSQSNTGACSNTGLVKISSTTAPSNVVANCQFTSAYDTGATPAAVTLTATQNGTTTSPTTLQMNITGGTPCAIGPLFTGAIPAPAAAAGYTTCAANYDFTTTNSFTSSGIVYNFSNIATWLGCSGQFSALWWPSSYNSPGTAPCQDFNIINDPSIGKNVLELTYTNADANNGVSATTMSLGNGGWGGGVPAQTHSFPQGIYLEFNLQILPSDVNPYAGVPQCAQGQPGGYYCEEFGFFSLNTAGPFNEWDFIESDTGYSGNGAFAYSGGNFIWAGNSPAPNNEFSYHDYGVLLTTDGATGIAKCTYVDGVHTTTGNQPMSPTGCYEHWDGGSVGFQYDQRQWWGLMLGAQEYSQCYFGGPCGAPNVSQHMRVQYIRVFSCANWASGACNTGIKLTP